MPRISIGVINPAEAERVSMQVPDDVPVGHLTEAMADQMGLSLWDQSGQRRHYHLRCIDPDGIVKRLDDDRTLEENGVREGAVLEIAESLPLNALLAQYAPTPASKSLDEADLAAPEKAGMLSEAMNAFFMTRKKADTMSQEMVAVLARLENVEQRVRALEDMLERTGDEVSTVSKILVQTRQDIIVVETKKLSAKRALAQIRLDRDIEAFGEAEQHNLIRSIAHYTGISEGDIELVDVISGSVEILLNMSEEAALRLMGLYLSGHRLIGELEIESIIVRPPALPAPERPLLTAPPSSVDRSRSGTPYLDFDITFSGSQPKYSVQASWSDGSHKRNGSHRFQIPVSLDELEFDYLSNMRIGTRESNRAAELARDLGESLFQAVFVDSVMECFGNCRSRAEENDQGVCIHLDLQDTPDLVNYPWELLWNTRDEFLALDSNTPVVRYLKGARPPRPVPLNPPLQMLVASACPPGHKPIETKEEVDSLKQALAELTEANLLNITWLDHATPTKLRQALGKNRELHILHYIGHGGMGQSHGGFLALENESGDGTSRLDGRRLSALLRDCHQIRLVTLNTCRGARPNAHDPFASIAMELTRARVPIVVAMQHEVFDQTAIVFARVFYGRLADGGTACEAMSEARKALYIDRASDIEWFIPVLYSHSPDGIVFRRADTTVQ